MPSSLLKRLALAAALALPLAATTARAQTSPTPEGTVIVNTATATFTDANNNSYAQVSASASVTVGFQAAVDVTAPASLSPASPSTGNALTFTINNVGNGRDSVSVTVTAAAGVSVTGYRYNGTTYPSVAALNGALGAAGINAGAAATVDVIFDVQSGQGGATLPVTLAATSRRSAGTSDAATSNVTPPVNGGINVTPDDGTPLERLPSNGVQYSQTFAVTNSGNSQDTFTLAASADANLAVVSVNGTAGTNGGSVVIAAGATQNVVVVYTVSAGAAAGALDSLRLTAASAATPATLDRGYVVVRTIKAAVTMTKQAFRDDQTTTIAGADRVLPGDYIQYKITVTNGGAAAAQTVAVSDPLPAQVTYDATTADGAGWTLSQAGGTVSGSLSGPLAAGASRYFWIRVRVK